ncbi:GDYXXLXY domain-containing protein [Fictibacillus enclensis]|nr:GDYXXLXY domain-containing protein [Fictibacillus enclensis]MDM5197662.1 GDYXXLXY domain-containing protein [Fictibacillus enclensis]
MLLSEGYRTEQRYQINWGIILFLLVTFIAYINLAWSFMPKSLFFLIGGILLFALYFFLQKKKKDVLEERGTPHEKNKWWIGLIILQVLVLLGIAGSYYGVDYFGKEIQLKTKPVDPSDVFSGDYVSLNYEISDAPDSLWKGKPIQEPTPVYVVLAPEKGKYHIEKLTNHSPDVSGSQVYLKAKATPQWLGCFIWNMVWNVFMSKKIQERSLKNRDRNTP